MFSCMPFTIAQNPSWNICTGITFSRIHDIQFQPYGSYYNKFEESKAYHPGFYAGIIRKIQMTRKWYFEPGLELSVRKYHDKNVNHSIFSFVVDFADHNNVVLSVYSVQLPVNFRYHMTQRLSLSTGLALDFQTGHAQGEIVYTLGYIGSSQPTSSSIEKVDDKCTFLTLMGLNFRTGINYQISQKMETQISVEEGLTSIIRRDPDSHYGWLYKYGRMISFGIGLNYRL